MNQPLNPELAIDCIPGHIEAGLVNVLRSAYSQNDQLHANSPILSSGPLAQQSEGFNRYIIVAHAIDKAVSEGRLEGKVTWIPFPKSPSGFYIEYSFQGYMVTFSHVQQRFDLPRQATYRMDRAHGNQLLLFPDKEELAETVTNVVLLHGNRNLDFAQFVILGLDEKGDQKALAYSRNLADDDFGYGDDEITPASPSGPTAPAPSEQIKPIRIALKKEFDTDVEKTDDAQ